jgi:peroxiredoxin
MRPTIRSSAAIALLAATLPAARGDEVRGRVVDDKGQPVAGVDVSYFWTANGPLNGKKGTPYDVETEEGRKFVLANHGKMFPLGDIQNPTRTRADGRFAILLGQRWHHLMAIDRARERGALAIVPEKLGNTEIEMRLTALVRVKGQVEGPQPGQRVKWPTAALSLPDDPVHPLDNTHLVIGGTLGGRFEMWLPPGRYVLELYNYTKDGHQKAAVEPDKEILLTGSQPELDLGIVCLSPYRATIRGRIAKAKAAGTWRDYSEHYGEKPPRWSAADARGIRKDAQLADFKGKWVLVYFWGFDWSRGLADLIRFYEQHAADRDRFEIITVCMDPEGRIKSMADFDKQAEPLVARVWKQQLPFPVLLDPSFVTWERFGLPAYGILLLVDPDGNMVKGDEGVLAEKLRSK